MKVSEMWFLSRTVRMSQKKIAFKGHMPMVALICNRLLRPVTCWKMFSPVADVTVELRPFEAAEKRRWPCKGENAPHDVVAVSSRCNTFPLSSVSTVRSGGSLNLFFSDTDFLWRWSGKSSTTLLALKGFLPQRFMLYMKTPFRWEKNCLQNCASVFLPT